MTIDARSRQRRASWLLGPTSPRGQVLVLACVSLLLIALMMVFSFGLSSAIHERIRIQSQADAQAFSVATLEARGLNVMVYTNRAIASTVVTNMSVHAWYAIASETVSILRGGESGMAQVAAQERGCCAKGMACKDDPVASTKPWCIQCQACCADVLAAEAISAKFGAEARNWESTLHGTEADFNATVRGLNQAAIDLHVLQKKTLGRVEAEIGNEGSGALLGLLRARNAPRSTYVQSVHAVNKTEFSCAVEGWKDPDNCKTLLGLVRPKLTIDERSAIIADVSNASRGSFQKYCANGACEGVLDTQWGASSPYLNGIMGGEGARCLGFTGTAGVTELAPNTRALPPRNTDKAESVGAITGGAMAVTWRHGNGSAGLGSLAFSDERGGDHGPGHIGGHNAFLGIQRQEVCQDSVHSCFINFRGADPGHPPKDKKGAPVKFEDLDLGMPSVWGAVRQDLGLLRSGRHGPWQLNDEGKVRLGVGSGMSTELKLGPHRGSQTEAIAVSKAKVYFHELGAPTPIPNMFDPFWRAKLERFRCRELKELLRSVGDLEGAELVESGAPVEGQLDTTNCGAM